MIESEDEDDDDEGDDDSHEKQYETTRHQSIQICLRNLESSNVQWRVVVSNKKIFQT